MLTNFIQERGIKTAQELADILKAELGIKCRQEDHLYCFNYDQIESPKTHPIVRECRGIVLSEDLELMARTPERFFNLGEALEITDAFRWYEPFEVREKADGSFIKIYYDSVEGYWEIGTRGTCRAEVENYTGKLFRTMILEHLGVTESEFQDVAEGAFNENTTYWFEFISPDNRVVTPYSETQLVLLGAVLTHFGEEYGLRRLAEEVEDMNFAFGVDAVRLPVSYNATTREELVKLANSLGGLQEGFVIQDINGLRIKVKAESYVAVHKLRGESIPTPKRIAELVVTNETEEYLAYFPEERERFSKYQEAWEILGSTAEDFYQQFKDIEDQKEFANTVKTHTLSGVMFQARKSNKDFVDVLNSQRTAAKVAWLLGEVK